MYKCMYRHHRQANKDIIFEIKSNFNHRIAIAYVSYLILTLSDQRTFYLNVT